MPCTGWIMNNMNRNSRLHGASNSVVIAPPERKDLSAVRSRRLTSVLSIATRKQAMFATLVEQKMAESYKAQVDNPVDASYVHRINDLCEAVEKLLQTEGQR